MCTLLLLHRVVAGRPLVVAANRDEFYARPTLAPHRISAPVATLSGLDVQRGGSWMGVTRNGLFVGLTNQRPAAPADPTLHSRGEVVLTALRLGTLASALAYVRGLRGADFNPFNLAVGDGHALWALYVRPEGVEAHELAPGVHVLANDRLGSHAFPKALLSQKRVEARLHEPWPALREALLSELRTHEPPPEALRTPDVVRSGLLDSDTMWKLQALCVHTPSYGTRSATFCVLDDASTVLEYTHFDGPSCTNPGTDLAPLLYAEP